MGDEADSVTAGLGGAPAVRTVVSGRADFSAALDSFQGPLDLLLYLIKENEVEITEIPIALILNQYMRYIENAPTVDLQTAGEFLVMAATLMEIKSRELLPVQEQAADGEEIIEDPRSELVKQLLQYRKLKEQARWLQDLQDQWEERRPRGFFGDVPELDPYADPEGAKNAARATAAEALADIDLFTLFAAYERVLKSILAQQPRNIILDTETLEEKIQRIERLLKAQPFARFSELLAGRFTRADIAATFLALLELVRRRAVRLSQQGLYGSLDVAPRQDGVDDALVDVEREESEALERSTLEAKAANDAALEQAAADGLPWKKRRQPARPKFEGIVRPEDVEELDAEEAEIARRIDAILAAADAISERFERSRDGKQREEDDPFAALQAPAENPGIVPDHSLTADGSPAGSADASAAVAATPAAEPASENAAEQTAEPAAGSGTDGAEAAEPKPNQE